MASDNEASCESDPNFAVICAFMEKFGVTCGLASIDFLELQEMLENTQEVPQELIDLHIKLLRKSRKTVSNERWEKAIIKFCHTFCVQDAWEIERFGYKKARLSSKLRVLKELLEMQFDYNARFKAEINKMSAEELRSQPLGKDKHGHAYWFQNDNNCQIRVYKEDPDEETWTLVAKDRDGLASLIGDLNDGDSKVSSESTNNEDDSNSLAEKPIIDTGQVDSFSSSESKKITDESDYSNESNADGKMKKNISPPDQSDENAQMEANIETGVDRGRGSKRRRGSYGGDGVEKKLKLEQVVGEAIEDPLVVVKGEGTGVENEGNPIVGEEIVEDVVYFYGVGSGVDCQTGNDNKSSDSDESKKVAADGNQRTIVEKDNSLSIIIKDVREDDSDNIDGSSKEVPNTSSPLKSPYKLGTIIDTKTDNKFFNITTTTTNKSPTKKSSRWDVETIIGNSATEPSSSSESVRVKDSVDKSEQINDDKLTVDETAVAAPKKSLFFFGRGCLQFKPMVSSCSATVGFGQKVPQTKLEEEDKCCKNEGQQVIPSNTKGDIGYRINPDHSKLDSKEVASIEESLSEQNITPIDKVEDVEVPILGNSDETEANRPKVDVETEEKLGEVSPAVVNAVVDEVKDECTASVKEESPTDSKTELPEVSLESVPAVAAKVVDEIGEVKSRIEDSDAIEELEHQIQVNNVIVTKTDDLRKIPEVTASLVEFDEEEKQQTHEEVKQETMDSANVNDKIDSDVEKDDSTLQIDRDEPNKLVPVTEEKCIKKYAYTLGDDDKEEPQQQLDEIDKTSPEKKSSEYEDSIQEKVDVKNVNSMELEAKLEDETKDTANVSIESQVAPVDVKPEEELPIVENEEKFETVDIKSPEMKTEGDDIIKADTASSKTEDVIPEVKLSQMKVENEVIKSDIEEAPIEDTIPDVKSPEVKVKEDIVVQVTEMEVTEQQVRLSEIKREDEVVKSDTVKETAEFIDVKQPGVKVEDEISKSELVDVKLEEPKREKDIPHLEISEESKPVEKIENVASENETKEIATFEKVEQDTVKTPTVDVKDTLTEALAPPVEVADVNKPIEQETVVSKGSTEFEITNLTPEDVPLDLQMKESPTKVENKPETPIAPVKSEFSSKFDVESNFSDNKIETVSEIIEKSKKSKLVVELNDIAVASTDNQSGVKILTVNTDLISQEVPSSFEKVENFTTAKVEGKIEELEEKSEEFNKVVDLESKPIENAIIETDGKAENVDEMAEDPPSENLVPMDEPMNLKMDEKSPIHNNKSINIGRKNHVTDEDNKNVSLPVQNEACLAKNEENVKPSELPEDHSKVAPKESVKMTKKEPQIFTAPRRGRSRGILQGDESLEGEISKKIKLSPEANEEIIEPPIEVIEPESIQSDLDKDEMKLAETKDPLLCSAESGTAPTDPIMVDSSSNSCDIVEPMKSDSMSEDEKEDTNEEKPPLSLATFSLDFTETSPARKSGRKRSRESPQNPEDVEESAGKRIKMKARRSVDAQLRKSIEEQKKQELISSEDDNKNVEEEEEEGEEKVAEVVPEKKLGKKRGKHAKKPPIKREESTNVAGSDAELDQIKKNKIATKNKRLLSSLGIDPDKQMNIDENATMGVRQSRRIAQLKIKEEAERRKLEEEMAKEVHEYHKKKKSKKSEDKDYKVEKKKLKSEMDDDDTVELDSADSKKRKKKKKHKKLFDEHNPWRSSSDSSSSAEEEEEEIAEESDDDHLQYVSDHEFSPESDLEGDEEALPLKRARTARKESDVEEVDDCPCQKCGKSDHPEWILLCDRCDNGWHCSCLRPPLLVIPEGDWFCPPCQHINLLKKLQEKLTDYDKKLNKKEVEDRRKQRLAYVGISLNNVLPTKESEKVKKRRRDSHHDEDDDEDEDDDDDEVEMSSGGESESESASGSVSESASDSDEPIYQLRQRRQAHSYRFNDYDELINSAIQDEMEAVKGAGNQGRGKDISTIVNAELEENNENVEVPVVEADVPEVVPSVVPPPEEREIKVVYSDEEPISSAKKKIIGRKKHRKLNSLDVSSEDDEDSDEDFKGTSSESEDDFDEDLGSEDSEDLYTGRRRKNDPVRRSTRARTSRYDADFIDDGDSEEEDEAPSRKKKRSIWDESESEESDRSWGRRKRRQTGKQRKPPTNPVKKKKSSSSKKKKKADDDSDAEVYRKKKPKIKFGMDGDGEDEGPGRRTRGKKINYVDALGSDSDEDRVKRPPPRIESEEEYVANEDDDEIDEDDKASDEEESGDESKTSTNIHIQSFADARFTQPLPEGVPTPKNLFEKNNSQDGGGGGDDELNPIDMINKNLEEMDENEMEKMMEEEEYANKQLQLVALQIEKEKKRKEREAKAKLEAAATTLQPPPLLMAPEQQSPKKRGRKPKNQFQFNPAMQEPIVGNVDNLIVNSDNNDELSEPPGVSLPMFAELGGQNDGLENDPLKKRRAVRNKKSLEEAVANLGTSRQIESGGFMTKEMVIGGQESNIEIAAPPQPFSQSQPTPSVITRMLQSKPGQPGYPVGTIRPKQFAAMPDREEEAAANLAGGPPISHHSLSPAPSVHHAAPPGQFIQGGVLRPQLSSPFRQIPPTIGHYPPRGAPPPPHQIRNPVPQTLPAHLYHSHRPMDPSPSGGGAMTINVSDHNSPNRVVSPASSSPGSNKNETPPPPYSRPPVAGRFPMIPPGGAPRHLSMVAPHLQSPRASLSPFHPGMPPNYHYGQFGQPEDAMPPTVYQSSPYSAEHFNEGHVNQSENSNSKSFDEESGGEFGGLVSYFSSQREDDLES